jgi:uncharacterized membrane protein (UPF0127 family)
MNEGKNPLRDTRIALGIGEATIEVEVAGRGAGMNLGLMFRETMGENEGMWFEYPDPEFLSFWMHNTKLPLSIAFVRENGVIGNIENMIPYDETSVRSKYESRYALEMNRSWFEKNGIKAGDTIRIGKKSKEPATKTDSP